MHAVCLLYACSYLYVVQSCIQFTHCALQRHVPVASATWLVGEALQVARTCGDPFSGREQDSESLCMREHRDTLISEARY